MWGKLGGQDWNAALTKITNAVAPRPGDDDDEYDEYDDEGEEEYEEEEEEEYEDETEENGQPAGFGFVGLLARALEPNQPSGEVEESERPTFEEISLEPSDTFNMMQPVEEPDVPVDTTSTLSSQILSLPPTLEVQPGLSSLLPQQEITTGSPQGLISNDPQARKFHDDWANSPPTSPRLETKSTPDILPSVQAERSVLSSLAPDKDRKSHDQPKEQATNHKDLEGMGFSSRQVEILEPPRPEIIESDADIMDPVSLVKPSSHQNQPPTSPPREPSKVRTSSIEQQGLGKTLEGDQVVKAPLTPVVLHANPTPQNQPHLISENPLPPPIPSQEKGSNTLQEASNVASLSIGDSPVPLQPATTTKDSQPPHNGTIKASRATTLESDESNKDVLLLCQAEAQILDLQKRLQEETEKSNQLIETMMIQFQEKEARLLQASSEEHQHELALAEHRHQVEMQSLEMRLANEKKEFVKGQQKVQQLIEQSNLRAERAEQELNTVTKKHETQLAQVTNQEQRSARMVEEKLAQTMALLDDRDEEISRLKETVKKLESSMNEHEEGVEEAEQEVEELQSENEALQDQVELLETQCKELKEKVSTLEGQARELGVLQMELTMVREERDRERAKSQSMVQSTISSQSQLESERDAAIAEVRDLKQQLRAAQADLDIARADQQRIVTANTNLQSALEAFQDERQAEMNMLDEQRLESEEAIQSAHVAATEALKQTHAAEIRQFQLVAETRLKQATDVASDLKASLNKVKSEHLQTRRALDEAIHRLQTTQEDVIDRTLMKNILIDWCTMKDKDKRHQVLQLMASVLHFTEEEKESVHLTHLDIESVRSRVVGALAAPIPPPKSKPEDLKGDNVSEKWINFLLTETDDDF